MGGGYLHKTNGGYLSLLAVDLSSTERKLCVIMFVCIKACVIKKDCMKIRGSFYSSSLVKFSLFLRKRGVTISMCEC